MKWPTSPRAQDRSAEQDRSHAEGSTNNACLVFLDSFFVKQPVWGYGAKKKSQELSIEKADQSTSKVQGTTAVTQGKWKKTEGDKVCKLWTGKRSKEQIFPNKNHGICSLLF